MAQRYIIIRTLQERIKVAVINEQSQVKSLSIARAKLAAGDVSELDANQAESLLNNTRATVSQLETSLQQTKNALAVLLGLPPADLSYLLQQDEQIPSAPPDIALGMPQDLIRQRPDVRIAERQLAAQSAQIGVASADLYPAFAVGGSIGSTAQTSGDLFNGDSKTWDLFSAFQWNLFNYGRLKSNVRLQDAVFQQLLVDYRNTVLQAQGDVENSIVAYLKAHEQSEFYRTAAAASQRALDVATIQYKEGDIDFDTLITTLGANLQQQDLYATIKGTTANNLVQVYRALGGGWRIRADQDPVDLLPQATREVMRERTRAWRGVLQ